MLPSRSPKYTSPTLTIQEAAQLLDVSTKTLRRWEEQGTLIPSRSEGGHRRYSRALIENFKRRSDRYSGPSSMYVQPLSGEWSQPGALKPLAETIPAKPPNPAPLPEKFSVAPVVAVSERVSFKAKVSSPSFGVKPYAFSSGDASFRRARVRVWRLAVCGVAAAIVFALSSQAAPLDARGTAWDKIWEHFQNVRQAMTFQDRNSADSALGGRVVANREASDDVKGRILGEADLNDIRFAVNVPSNFKQLVIFENDIQVDGSATIATDLAVAGDTVLTGDLAVNSGNLTTTAAQVNLFNTVAQTLNFAGAAGQVNIGSTTGTITTGNDLVVTGNIGSIQGVPYTFPTAQGASTTFLQNDGDGNLSWGTITIPTIPDIPDQLTDLSGVLPISQGGTNNSAAYTSGSVIFSDGTKLTQDNTNFYWDDTNNRLGIGDSSPTAALTIGSGDLFQVKNDGDISSIRGIAYSFPAVQGGVNTVLANDGSGGLTWVAQSSIAPDSLDFSDFVDNMTLDASTDIAEPGAFVLSLTNDASGNSFLVNDNGNADTTPFVIDLSGSVGIGTKLHVVATSEQARLGYDASNYVSFNVNSGGDLTLTPTGNDLTISAYTTINGTTTITPTSPTALEINPYGTGAGQASELQFKEGGATSTQYVGFKAPDSLTTSVTYTLPNHNTTVPSSDYVLTWQPGNILEWKALSGGGGGTGDITAVGDVLTGDAFTNGGSGNSLFFNNNANVGQLTAATLNGTRTWTLPDLSGTVTVLGNTTTGSGNIVLATSPILVTPNIGVATATSVNGLTITSTTGTLGIANGATLNTSGANSLTLVTTATTNATFPTGLITVADLESTQTFTGAKTFADLTITDTNVALTGASSTLTSTGALTLVSGSGTTAVTGAADVSGALSAGTANGFAVDASGNITSINAVTYSFPASQGAPLAPASLPQIHLITQSSKTR